MMLLTFVILFISLVVFYYTKVYFRFRNLGKHVSFPTIHPIFGNIFLYFGTTGTITNRIIQLTTNQTKRFGIWHGPFLALFLVTPKDIETVLKSSTKIDKGNDYVFFKKIIGESTFTLSPGARLKQHRKIVVPWFTMRNLKNLIENFNETSDDLVKNLTANVGKTFDVTPLIADASIKSLAETVVGLDRGYVNNNGPLFNEIVEELSLLVMERMSKIWLQYDFIYKLSPKKKIFDKYLQKIDDIVNYAIQQKRKIISADKNFQVFSEFLINSKMNDGTPFPDESIRDEIKTMLIAGHSTTTTSLCYLLCLLGLYKDIQEKLYKEVTSVLGKDGEDFVSYEDVMKLEYMDQVIYETWRLYPPGALIAKYTFDDIQLEDVTIPKNTTVNILAYGLHRNPEIYPNPHQFNPDNFLPENVEKRHPFSFIPFSLGNRACIGQKYTYLIQKIALAKIVKNFKIHSYVPEKDFNLTFEVTLKRKDGYPILLEPRETKNGRYFYFNCQ